MSHDKGEVGDLPQELAGTMGSMRIEAPMKLSCKERNDRKWNLYKNEIRQIYMDEDNTLRTTMRTIEHGYQFKAS
jgi:hypothetical protein